MRLHREWGAAVAMMAVACAAEPEVPTWCSVASEQAIVRMAGEASPRTLRLVELWRVGGGDGEAVFSGPTRAGVSRSGRVAVPDMRGSEVLIVEPDGTWRGSIVQEGDGPGEVRWPVDAEWIGEDRLAVFDLAKGEVLTISDTGQLIGDPWRVDPGLYARIAASGSLPGGDLMSDGSLLLELPWEPREGQPGSVGTVVRLQPGGAIDSVQAQAVLVVNQGPFRNWPVPGAPRPLYAAGATGPLFRGGRDAHYRVVVSSQSLKDSVVLCRAVPPLEYTSAEQGLIDEPVELARMIREAPRPPVPAGIGGLLAGENGRLWVLRTRPDPVSPTTPVEGGEYDLYSETGRLIGNVRAPDRVYLVGEGGGQVYGFERGPFDEVILVAYRLAEGA